MKILALTALLTLVGCGSTGTSTPRTVDPASGMTVTNKDFQKKAKIPYSKADDHYGAASPSNVLASESAERPDATLKDSISQMKDPLGTMILSCYQKDFKEGFELAQGLFETHQNLPSYWNQVATCHLLQGNERKALLFYNKALEVTPNYVPALNNIGVIYGKTGQDQKALVAIQKSLNGGKFTKTPRYNLAFLLLRYGLAEEASGHFRGLAEEAPQDPELRAGLANSLALSGRWKDAWEQFNMVPDGLRRRSDVGLNMALTAHKVGQSALAKNILDATQVSGADKDYVEEIRQVVGE